MKAALIVNTVTADTAANLAGIVKHAGAAGECGADLALFPEAALTGLINDDDPAHDLPLGEPIPGPVTGVLAECARSFRLWLAIGLLERAGERLFDSALLFNPQGEIVLHYRRIHPGWHGRRADPAVYGAGDRVPLAVTPWGTVAFLLCGDLFDDGVLARVRERRPHWLLVPFARCFADGSCSQERWDRDEQPQYSARVRQAGCPALLANYLADRGLLGGAFGGAFAVDRDGTLLGNLDLGRSGMLYLDLG